MILLLALAAGLLTGLALAQWKGNLYRVPELKYLWLVFAAFLPQFVLVYFPATRRLFPDWFAAGLLPVSQVMFLAFAWLNRRIWGMVILLCGVVLNLSVMTANGGFMPISPQTASRLVSEDTLQDSQSGSRFGPKDVLLDPQDTRFEWLADRFLPPAWFPYQVAFSLGDVFIALGVFFLLANPVPSMKFIQRGIFT